MLYTSTFYGLPHLLHSALSVQLLSFQKLCNRLKSHSQPIDSLQALTLYAKQFILGKL